VAFNTERGSFGGTVVPRTDSNGKRWIKAKAHGDLTAKVPYAISGGASGLLTKAIFDTTYVSTTGAAHANFYVGVPDDAISSGTFGWLQIGGDVSSVTTPNSCTGVAGQTFRWKDASIVGSGTTDIGYFTDFAVCTTSTDDSTTQHMFLLERKVCGIT